MMFMFIVEGFLPNQSGTPPEPTAFRVTMTILYGLMGLLGGWWIYFFNTLQVKDLFRDKGYPIAPPIPIPLQEPIANTRRTPRPPVSITVIAALLLIAALNGPGALLVHHFFHLPVLFFGSSFQDWGFTVILIAYVVVQFAAGIGLLKLKMWARTFAIWYFVFAILNGLVTAIRPGGFANLEQIAMDAYSKIMPPQVLGDSYQQFLHQILHLSIMSGSILGLVAGGVQLWILVTQKQAFLAANHS
jgi:hypothetical protein